MRQQQAPGDQQVAIRRIVRVVDGNRGAGRVAPGMQRIPGPAQRAAGPGQDAVEAGAVLVPHREDQPGALALAVGDAAVAGIEDPAARIQPAAAEAGPVGLVAFRHLPRQAGTGLPGRGCGARQVAQVRQAAGGWQTPRRGLRHDRASEGEGEGGTAQAAPPEAGGSDSAGREVGTDHRETPAAGQRPPPWRE
nr:hypothetical protein [Falsiroseomonas tokyonensis]